jgi:hypothetical protein
MDQNEQKIKFTYLAATKLLEASKLIVGYNPALSNVILMMSEALVDEISQGKKRETDPEKSNRISDENVDKIRGELSDIVEEVKEKISKESEGE